MPHTKVMCVCSILTRIVQPFSKAVVPIFIPTGKVWEFPSLYMLATFSTASLKNIKSLWDLWDLIKCTKIHIMGIAEEPREKIQMKEKWLKISNIWWKILIQHIQEAQLNKLYIRQINSRDPHWDTSSICISQIKEVKYFLKCALTIWIDSSVRCLFQSFVLFFNSPRR